MHSDRTLEQSAHVQAANLRSSYDVEDLDVVRLARPITDLILAYGEVFHAELLQREDGLRRQLELALESVPRISERVDAPNHQCVPCLAEAHRSDHCAEIGVMRRPKQVALIHELGEELTAEERVLLIVLRSRVVLRQLDLAELVLASLVHLQRLVTSLDQELLASYLPEESYDYESLSQICGRRLLTRWVVRLDFSHQLELLSHDVEECNRLVEAQQDGLFAISAHVYVNHVV